MSDRRYPYDGRSYYGIGDPRKADENFLDRNILRLRHVVVASAVVLGIGATAYAVDRFVDEVDSRLDGPTVEQKIAKIQLEQAGEDQIVHNLVVKKDGANLRDKPLVDDAVPNFEAGEIEGSLDEGDEVEVAGVVWGNDPDNVLVPGSQSKWYVFEDPSDSSRVVFAHSDRFVATTELDKTIPLEIDQ